MARASHFANLLADAQHELNENIDALDAMAAVCQEEGRDMSDEEHAESQKLTDRNNALDANIKRYQATLDQVQRNQAAKADAQLIATTADPAQGSTALTVPATVSRFRSEVFDNQAEAYAMGMYLHAIAGNRKAVGFCSSRNIGGFRAAMEGGTDTLGGFTVPDPLSATILRLIQEYGVYRQNARNIVMTSDTQDVPKYDESQSLDPTVGIGVEYPNEGVLINPSDIVFAQVNLIAKKYATLALMSTELAEDSVINMVDLVARDIATKFAHAEDVNSFLGDGSPTFGGITGIANALQASALVAGGAGLWGGIGLDTLTTALGKLANYAGLMPKWYMSRFAYYEAIIPALSGLGGSHWRHFEEGGNMQLLGYPVQFTNVLPSQGGANGNLAIVVGDLDLGAYSGQRRQLWLRVLNELYAATDQIGVQATMRCDSVIHSVGTATATDSAGAICGITLST